MAIGPIGPIDRLVGGVIVLLVGALFAVRRYSECIGLILGRRLEVGHTHTISSYVSISISIIERMEIKSACEIKSVGLPWWSPCPSGIKHIIP